VADAHPRIQLAYRPRPQFLPFHARKERWACIVAHRRAGKTVAACNDLIARALATKKENARFGYLAPYRGQAKSISWDYLKRYSRPLAPKVSETELSLRLANGAEIRVFGADNPDALRGLYFDGVCLDEPADIRPSVWGEILRPALADRKGWAVFLGTPKGHNAFHEIHEQAEASPEWYSAVLKASETGLIPEAELEDARKMMTAAQFEQEFSCSFEAAIQGAIFAKELQAARDAGRIGRVPYDPALPVHTAFDLGVGDSTAIWFIQLLGQEARLIDYFEASGEGLPFYAKILQERGYVYGRHIAPHDIAVRELGSGRSRIEVAASLGIKFEIAPNVPLEDGIHAARLWMSRCFFDETKCKAGLEALQHYRWDFNDRLGEFKSRPIHDFASHGSDAYRYAALALKDKPQIKPARPQRENYRGDGGWMR
jgi:phage terminase large subunit